MLVGQLGIPGKGNVCLPGVFRLARENIMINAAYSHDFFKMIFLKATTKVKKHQRYS